MITLHLYRDRNGHAVAKIDAAEGRRMLTPTDAEDVYTLLCDATWDATDEHPRALDERRIVSRLADMMRKKLSKRRHHGSWHDLWPDRVFGLLESEVTELVNALAVLRHAPGESNRESAIYEAVDVANCCAILIDVLVGDES